MAANAAGGASSVPAISITNEIDDELRQINSRMTSLGIRPQIDDVAQWAIDARAKEQERQRASSRGILDDEVFKRQTLRRSSTEAGGFGAGAPAQEARLGWESTPTVAPPFSPRASQEPGAKRQKQQPFMFRGSFSPGVTPAQETGPHKRRYSVQTRTGWESTPTVPTLFSPTAAGLPNPNTVIHPSLDSGDSMSLDKAP